ncbi:MAG TPA: AAA family ATPase [Blastocatellia bacterium]|nr:AAA family ATPase [Blastocatellia bacterium]
MSESSADNLDAITPGAKRLVEAASQKQQRAGHAELCVTHWMLALLERHGPMAESLASGLAATTTLGAIENSLNEGRSGKPLARETVLSLASERARARGKPQATERDLAAVILAADGYTLIEESAAASASTPATVAVQAETPPPDQPQKEGPQDKAPQDNAEPAVLQYRPRAKQPTPTLEQFGRDLTREAVEGRLPPFVGREEEIQLAIETLCRRQKRNPVLVGPAGVGKTAIVEGLAHRIARGDVPEVLRGSRLLAIQPSTLVAGASVLGEVEKRMKAIIEEASQEAILLFIDEVHSIMGAGGREGTSDIASLLKPALARGGLACIAATTDDEYRRFIETDSALERRFQPIRVQEMTAGQTLEVLAALRDDYAATRGVRVADDVLGWLLDFASRFLRNRYFPDKAVDLLEQCVAHAIAHSKTAVDQTTARTVAQRIVGMPIAIEERESALKEALLERALLTEEEVRSLVNRLRVTMRGLDLRPSRPNATILLIDEVAENGEAVANVIAESLFGAAERVVAIDFSRFTQPHDITMLIGAPPGYVGYSETLPLHRVAQMPWCVLRCENLDACHPAVLEVLTNALSEGFLTDARGKRIYLSDTVVVLTAGIKVESRRRVPGFRHKEDAASKESRSTARQAAEHALGAELVDQCDLVSAEVLTSDQASRLWLKKHLLSDITDRYHKQGLKLHWDDSVIEWLMEQKHVYTNERDWERFVDERLSPLLIHQLPERDGQEIKTLLLKYDGVDIQVHSGEHSERNE